jgi:hypothetical protein
MSRSLKSASCFLQWGRVDVVLVLHTQSETCLLQEFLSCVQQCQGVHGAARCQSSAESSGIAAAQAACEERNDKLQPATHRLLAASTDCWLMS